MWDTARTSLLFFKRQWSAAALQEQLAADQIPESETIIRLRGAIVNLETTRKQVEKARETRDDAAKALLRAEAALNESPFVGQTPEAVISYVNNFLWLIAGIF